MILMRLFSRRNERNKELLKRSGNSKLQSKLKYSFDLTIWLFFDVRAEKNMSNDKSSSFLTVPMNQMSGTESAGL